MRRALRSIVLQFAVLQFAVLHFVALLLVMCAPPVCAAAAYQETPYFAERVGNGGLPPVAERVPAKPRLIDLSAPTLSTGTPGGTLRLLMGDQRDIRMMTIYGYARLVVFNQKSELEADILESFDVDQSRVFTLHLRPGHKWSDGHAFTTEDFRYFWEDVANNDKLNPGGPPPQMLTSGKKPKVDILDALTIRYTWDEPNPSFLPALASGQPLYIYMPAHYMRQFHARYSDKDVLAAAAKAAKVKDWSSLHERKSRMYRPENPDLPALDPWVNRTPPPSEQYIFERNPFYHRIDANGRQLPYIDKVLLSLGSTSLIPAKVGSGEGDLQARYLRFDNYTFLKDAETRHNYKVRLWQNAIGSFVALTPNFNTLDQGWRALVRDVRFRRALSMGINRHDINQCIFFGLAREAANTVLPASPLFKPEYATAYTQYDQDAANTLLDEVGLKERDWQGFRKLPDGRRAELIIETAGENSEETDILELVASDFGRLGLRIIIHGSQRDVFRRRIMAGQTVLSATAGIDNALPGPDMAPDSLAPSNRGQMQWPRWGEFVESNGAAGEAADLPEAMQLIKLLKAWRQSSTTQERAGIWRRMLEINADQIFTIGIISGTQQPVVISNRLNNVPASASYSFDPGAYFGMYQPDTFWFSAEAAK